MNIRFSEKNWEQIEKNWTHFWAGELKRPIVWIECEDGSSPVKDKHYFIPQYSAEISAEEIIEIETEHLERIHFIGDSFPKFWLNFGTGSAAAYLGSDMRVSDSTVWFESSGKDLEDIKICSDVESYWYKRVQNVLEASLKKLKGSVQVGFSDIGGNLDILASLRGTQNLLFDLYDKGDILEKLCKDLTREWIRLYKEEAEKITSICPGTTPWAPVWSKRQTYMLQSDFSSMISPDMFERFVLPDLTACCEVIDDPFYHFDGKGALPHLDMLLSLEKLKGVQWIPGDGQPPADKWLDVLKRIRDAGKYCQVFVSMDGAMDIKKELGAEGFIFVIRHQGLSPEDARRFFSELAE